MIYIRFFVESVIKCVSKMEQEHICRILKASLEFEKKKTPNKHVKANANFMSKRSADQSMQIYLVCFIYFFNKFWGIFKWIVKLQHKRKCKIQRQKELNENQPCIHINTGSDVKVGMFVHFPFRWKTVLCAGPIWCSESALGTLTEIERLRNHRMTTNVRKSRCSQWSLRCCCVHILRNRSCSRSGIFNVTILYTAVSVTMYSSTCCCIDSTQQRCMHTSLILFVILHWIKW